MLMIKITDTEISMSSITKNKIKSQSKYKFIVPENDSSFSIIDIEEVGVIREDDEGIKPETEEEKTLFPSTKTTTI